MSRLDETRLNAIADRLLNDFDAHHPGTEFADGLRLEIDDAWRVQGVVTQLREQRGESVIGYKIGCACEHNQQMMGLTHPVWGQLWSTEQ